MKTKSRISLHYLSIVLVITSTVLTGCSKKNGETESSAVQQEQTGNNLKPLEVVQKSDNQEIPKGQATWAQHIVSHSQGWIPAEQAIKVRFTHPVVPKERLNQSIDGIVTIVPQVDIDAVFTSQNELTLRHRQRPLAGQIFSISITPKNLADVPKTLNPFNFQVQVLKQNFELNVSGLVPGEEKGLMSLKGSIRTADTVDDLDIEKTLSLEQHNIRLPIRWQHSDDQLSHDFVITGIVRGEQPSTVNLNYSSVSIGVEKEGVYSVDVPAIDQFTVTAARTIQSPEQYVEVSFSEALDRNQNLHGLVRLGGKNASVRVDGSYLRIYPSGKQSGVFTLEIEDTVKSAKNLQLPEAFQANITFISELPGIRFFGGGSILPPGKDLRVPFEAINVNAVWVTAFKVYENNIQQFLQSYAITSDNLDRRTGRYLWRKKITLPSIPTDQWQQYDIDVNEIMENHGDGIVNLTLSIDSTTVAYNCPDSSSQQPRKAYKSYDGPNVLEEIEKPDWFQRYYSHQNGYVTYDENNDPCHPEYYSYYWAENVTASRNFLVSDIGLLVKKGSSNTLHIVATGIKSGTPKKNTQIRVYNYQHQVVGEGVTDNHGMVTIEPKDLGFYLVAENKNDRSYIRFPRNEALPTSQFDTGGEKVRKSLKGFIYGERDVWRPGDDIFLTFVLQDKLDTIPEGHPVSLDFFDPRGTKVSTLINSNPAGDLYTFALKTEESSPTGIWRAVARVGGEYFDKTIKIETITPNRLKVEVSPSQRPIKVSTSPVRTELFAQWLNGATAKNLKADAEIKLRPKKTRFQGWSQFGFDDPASSFKQYQQTLFDGKLDNNGRAVFDLNLQRVSQAPGKLQATFVTRVFEQSGNFSTSIRNEEVIPYQNWVGINIPKGSGYRGAIARDKDHSVEILSINSDAEVVANRKLSISVYHIGWRWWWDRSEENLANYVRGRNSNQIIDEEFTTDDEGRARWILEKNKYDWGRHLVRVCDQQSGHCAGQEVYLGWSWSNQVNPDTATQLTLATDKERYSVGDTAIIRMPKLAQGKVLYSIETGSQVLTQKWLELKPGASGFEVPVTADMAPNVYINAVLLLPHLERKSDAPIRMYGITPLLVDNPDSHITPLIESPESVRPSSTFDVKVSEKNGKKMSYTLAVVDEGLLGITSYRTPNPHDAFYRRESLGVITWDVFDGVIGAYGANLERLLRIGGGDSGKDGKEKKQRRFPPVVKFLGAFTLAAGENKTHTVKLPQYMGAVRVMAVAADGGAYGQAERAVTVTQPLTLLATLPRVLGPKENVSLPVNVFVNNDAIENVEVTVTADDLFIVKRATQSLSFDGPGDQIAMLELEVKDRVGIGAVTVVAKAGNETTEQTINIESRSPNVASTVQETKLLQPGEIWQPNLLPNGMDNTNISSVAVSSFPPLNLERRLEYLIRYPHGCIEQTTSAVFPQIWLHNITELSAARKNDIQNNVNAAINKFRSFQNASGSFSYWPGRDYVNDWSSIYVTHFLTEAKALGYAVPTPMLNDAIKYLRSQASTINEQAPYTRLVAAYRLYLLALTGSPELAAMNRLREALLKNTKNYNDSIARWHLALAYQSLGLQDVSQELIDHAENTVKDYRYSDYTYGSTLRDLAMLLMAYSETARDTIAWETASEIAKLLSQDRRYSTHSTAWAFLAMSKYAKGVKGESNRFAISEFAHKKNDSEREWQAINSIATVYQQKLSPHILADSRVLIRNDSERPLHASVSNTGVPSEGEEKARAEGLSLAIQFTDMDGKPINVDSLPQGKDFIAEASVTADNHKNSYKIEDIAMTMVMPSGWQIRNERLEGDNIPQGLDYQDIRDDRMLSYFSLWKNYYWRYRYSHRNQDQQKIQVILNASFAGRFYLPGWQVRSMYDEEIMAQSIGRWVTVVSQTPAQEVATIP